MSTAVTTKIVALGAVGSLIAQQATAGLGRIRACMPSVQVSWPASETAAEVASAAKAVVTDAVVELAEVSREIPSNWRLATSAAIGAFACWSGPLVYRKTRDWYRRRQVWTCGGYAPESVVEGSMERSIMEPRCMVKLAFRNDAGEYVLTGWGYRADYNEQPYIITAQHCLDLNRKMYLRKGEVVQDLDLSEFHVLGVDAVAVKIPKKAASVLGLQKAKLGLLNLEGQAVSVLGLTGRGTTGLLTRIPRSRVGHLGAVRYSGTTMAGYSGSAYFSGNTVYGIHTCGGNYNGGLNSMFLHVMSKIATDDKSVDESPALVDKWYDDPNTEVEIEWEGDVAILTDGSKYVRLTKEQYERAQNRYEENLERQRRTEEEMEEYDRQQEREYECGHVVQPPPLPQQVTVQIPVNGPPPQPAVSGNESRPGTSRGGSGSELFERTSPENPPQQTPEPPKLSRRSSKKGGLYQRLQQLETTISQRGSNASTTASKSTQKTA